MSYPPETLRVLLLEDEPAEIAALERMLSQEPGSRFILSAHTDEVAEALKIIGAGAADLVLFGLSEESGRGLEKLLALHGAAPELPFVVLGSIDNEEMALEALKYGAQEYLVKGRTDRALLHRTLRYAVGRARAEAQLEHERDLFQTLLENIPDRIYFKDHRSRFIRINRALMELFHLERLEDAYGKTDADFYGGNHAQEALEDERRVMETGEPLLAKIEYETLASGDRSWSLTTKLPLRDRQGRIIGTCGISREITAMKKMEQDLSTERNLLRSVIDNLPDLIFLKDLQGRYLLDNAAHMRWLGARDSSEVIGKSVFDFFSRESAAGFQEKDLAIMRSGEALVNYEEFSADPQGQERWVVTSKIPLKDDHGEVLGLVGISRDVSRQKRVEERLKQANADLAARREDLLAAVKDLQEAHLELRTVQLQLVEAEKMKSIGRLAAGVAHEVKNPLAIIKMGVDFLTAHRQDEPETLELLQEMDDAVTRADSVIRGLLDFSTPKPLQTKAESLNAILDKALTMVRGELKGAFEIERDLDPKIPLLKVDPDKIGQVFINLLTNAIHAMEGRGTLSVRTYAKQLTGIGANVGDRRSESFRVGETLVIAQIDDTGPGIPEEKLGKIFEPFYTTKPTGKGTGLGLSVVKTIVDLHRATIDLQNLPEGGARATVTFQA